MSTETTVDRSFAATRLITVTADRLEYLARAFEVVGNTKPLRHIGRHRYRQ